jgi:hypothetical protein
LAFFAIETGFCQKDIITSSPKKFILKIYFGIVKARFFLTLTIVVLFFRHGKIKPLKLLNFLANFPVSQILQGKRASKTSRTA